MRLVQQIAQLIARVAGLRQQGRNEEAVKEIDNLCLQTAGLPLSRIRQSSPESLASFLETGGALRYDRAITLAALLQQDAELSEIAARPAEALVSRLHAFCLLADSVHVLPAQEQAEYRQKMNALAEQLQSVAAHPYAGAKLREYAARRDAAGTETLG